MSDAPDPRDERRDDKPKRARRSAKAADQAKSAGTGGRGEAQGSGPGAGASRGGDPGRSGRSSGGGRRRYAPTPRATEPGTDGTGGTDPAEAYLAAYLDAVERGDEPPDLAELEAGARADVEAVLALLAGVDPGVGAGAGHDEDARGPRRMTVPTGQGKSRRNALAVRAMVARGAAGTNPGPQGDGSDVGDDGSPELRPLGESEFAVEHGLSRTNPDVVVSGPAVREARAVTGMTTVDVAEEMGRRGYAIAAEAVEALEQRTAHRMHPRDARLLAAVLDLPLDTIEATAAPWSSDPAVLAELAEAADDATPVVLGDDVVLRTGTGSHLGVLRCAGGAEVLDSRTYRQAAAARLVGPWSQLAGALLVADGAPHLALAVDALDCVARQHAPSGLIGFSRLAEPESIAEALASYDRAYAINWSDPDPLEGLATRPDQAAEALAGRIEGLAERLADEARRSRQIGKRPGYTAAARWLRETPTADMVALLDELAHADPDEARRRIEQLTEVVLA